MGSARHVVANCVMVTAFAVAQVAVADTPPTTSPPDVEFAPQAQAGATQSQIMAAVWIAAGMRDGAACHADKTISIPG